VISWQQRYKAQLLSCADVDREIDRVKDEIWAATNCSTPRICGNKSCASCASSAENSPPQSSVFCTDEIFTPKN
jgi:hypothetical protein